MLSIFVRENKISNFCTNIPQNHRVCNVQYLFSHCVRTRHSTCERAVSWKAKNHTRGTIVQSKTALSLPLESSGCVCVCVCVSFTLQVLDLLCPEITGLPRCVKCTRVGVINPLAPPSQPRTEACHLNRKRATEMFCKQRENETNTAADDTNTNKHQSSEVRLHLFYVGPSLNSPTWTVSCTKLRPISSLLSLYTTSKISAY